MFSFIRTAVRFFFIGFGTGLLLAPRAGAETRQLIRDKLNDLVESVLEVADLPPVEAGEGAGAKAASRGARTGRRSESGAGAAED